MLGSVAEWTADQHLKSLAGVGVFIRDFQSGGPVGRAWVVRGGSWDLSSSFIRAAARMQVTFAMDETQHDLLKRTIRGQHELKMLGAAQLATAAIVETRDPDEIADAFADVIPSEDGTIIRALGGAALRQLRALEAEELRRSGGAPIAGSKAQIKRRQVEDELRAWTAANPTARERLAWSAASSRSSKWIVRSWRI